MLLFFLNSIIVGTVVVSSVILVLITPCLCLHRQNRFGCATPATIRYFNDTKLDVPCVIAGDPRACMRVVGLTIYVHRNKFISNEYVKVENYVKNIPFLVVLCGSQKTGFLLHGQWRHESLKKPSKLLSMQWSHFTIGCLSVKTRIFITQVSNKAE